MKYVELKRRAPGCDKINTNALLVEVIKSIGGHITDDLIEANKPTNPDFFLECHSGIVAIENKNAQEDWLHQSAVFKILEDELKIDCSKRTVSNFFRFPAAESPSHDKWRSKLREKFQSYLRKANSQLQRGVI